MGALGRRVGWTMTAVAALVACSFHGYSGSDSAPPARDDGAVDAAPADDAGSAQPDSASPDAAWDSSSSDGGSAYAQAVLADHPYLYYRFDENAPSGSVHDSSGNGRDAQFKGNVMTGTSGAIANDASKAFTFDGASALVRPAGPTFAGNAPFTLEAWVQPTNVTSGHVFLANEGEPTDGWAFFFNNDYRPSIDRETPGGYSIAAGNAIGSVGYSHVVATYDGTTLQVWVEGVLGATAPATTPTPGSHGFPFVVGANQNADNNYFVGGIDEVAVYDHVLADVRIRKHRDVGRGLDR